MTSSAHLMGLFGINVTRIVNSALAAIGSWVGAGAGTLIGSFGHALNATTSVTFSSGFMAEFSILRSFGAELVVLFLCLVIIQAVIRQDLELLIRSVVLRLPAALLFSGFALEIVAALLRGTDVLSSELLHSASGATGTFVAELAAILAGTALSSPVLAGFEGLVLALALSIFVFVCWLELVVRAAAITVAVLFLPLALAGVVWPATQQWMRRLGETLFALIFSKVVICAIFALAISSIGRPQGVATVVEGIALFVLCAWSPFTLLRLLPLMEAGAIGHLESLGHRGGQALRHVATSTGPVIGDRLFPSEPVGVEQVDAIPWAPTDPSDRLEVDPESIDSFRFLGPWVTARSDEGRERNEDGSFQARPPSRVRIDLTSDGDRDVEQQRR